MLRRLASATLLLLFACDDGPACVIDTDCQGFEICVEESCVPLGGERDADVGDGPGDTDGGEGEDAGPTDMGPAPGSLGTGLVSAMSVPAGSDPLTEPGSHTVSASFTAAGGSSTCTTTEVGGCSVVTCEPPAPAGDAGMPEDMGVPEPDPFPHAGSVQLSGGSVEIAMEPAEDTGLYPVTTAAMQLFSQGDTLVGIGAGDEVPSFRTTGLEGVDQLAVTAPMLSDLGGPLTLDSTMATDVTWTAPETPTEDQTVRIGLTSVVGDGGSVSITCDAPAADGTFTLTPEVFAMMPGSASHRIRVITRDAESLDRDGWLITVEAWARGVNGIRNYDVGLDFSDRAAM
ncbi:MAG: hypothetical protein JJ863_10950 [Deltaproteobacteria bacterium]|nr:hypothetical protein [Deltaproteobacteria bacterium]